MAPGTICKRIRDCANKIDWDKANKVLTKNLDIPIDVTKSDSVKGSI